jgi:hypothetical protein
MTDRGVWFWTDWIIGPHAICEFISVSSQDDMTQCIKTDGTDFQYTEENNSMKCNVNIIENLILREFFFMRSGDCSLISYK